MIKKFFSFTFTQFLTIALCVLLTFSGCTQQSSDEVYSNKAETKKITFSLPTDEMLAPNVNSSDRTILCSNIDFSDGKDYHFYLEYQNSGSSKTTSVKEVFLIQNEDANYFNLDIVPGTYSFTLVVTVGESTQPSNFTQIKNEGILIGYTSADLRYTNEVLFYLGTKGLTGIGHADFSIYLDSTWSDSDIIYLNSSYRTKIGLYRLNTETDATVNSSGIIETPSKTTARKFSVSKLSAGTYDFSIKFINVYDTSLSYSYVNKVIISPNRTIDTQIYIPKIIDMLPEIPSDFCVSAVDPSSSDTTEFFSALFTWNDTSLDETGFKLELMDLSKFNSLPAVNGVCNDTIWNGLVALSNNDTTLIKEYKGDISKLAEYAAGSLNNGSNFLVLTLNLGGTYLARLCSYNDAGYSAYVYPSLDSAHSVTVALDTNGDFNIVYSGKPFNTPENPCHIINRFRISYNLNMSEAPDIYDGFSPYNGVMNIRNAIHEYYSYGSVSIWCPKSDFTTKTILTPALLKNNRRWTQWKIDSIFGTDFISSGSGSGNTITEPTVIGLTTFDYTYQKPNSYSGYKNLNLFAVYELLLNACGPYLVNNSGILKINYKETPIEPETSFIWGFSSDGTNWTAIQDATSSTYTPAKTDSFDSTGNLGKGDGYYRCVIRGPKTVNGVTTKEIQVSL